MPPKGSTYGLLKGRITKQINRVIAEIDKQMKKDKQHTEKYKAEIR